MATSFPIRILLKEATGKHKEMVCNTPDDIPNGIDFKVLEVCVEEQHPPYVTTTNGMRGWFAVLVHWNEEGFYEPWNTGFSSYKTKAEAEVEAKQWAEDEGIEFRP